MDQLPTLVSLGLNWGFKGGGWGEGQGAGKSPREQASTSIYITPIPARRNPCVHVLHNAQNFLWG